MVGEVGEGPRRALRIMSEYTAPGRLHMAYSFDMLGPKFTPEHFRTVHPGGKLGAKLSRVADLMHRDIPLVAEDAPMAEALLTISQKSFGVTGVTDVEGRLTGIITDGDLRRHMQGLLDRNAAEVMTRNPRSIGPDALAETAVAEMQSRRITSLFVVAEDGKPLGLVHIHDFLRSGLV